MGSEFGLCQAKLLLFVPLRPGEIEGAPDFPVPSVLVREVDMQPCCSKVKRWMDEFEKAVGVRPRTHRHSADGKHVWSGLIFELSADRKELPGSGAQPQDVRVIWTVQDHICVGETISVNLDAKLGVVKVSIPIAIGVGMVDDE